MSDAADVGRGRERGTMTDTRSWAKQLKMAVVVIAVLAAFLQPASAAETRSKASAYPFSPAQKRYIKTFGYPEQFILMFITEDVGPRKRIIRVLPQPRRLEAWFYLTRERYVIFDNGYFTEEVPTGLPMNDPEILPPTDLHPTQFTPATTITDLRERFGAPDKVESIRLGRHLVEVHRYLTPAKGIKSFTFYDGRLQAIVAGFAILPESGALERQK